MGHHRYVDFRLIAAGVAQSNVVIRFRSLTWIDLDDEGNGRCYIIHATARFCDGLPNISKGIGILANELSSTTRRLGRRYRRAQPRWLYESETDCSAHPTVALRFSAARKMHYNSQFPRLA